ncbi:MAG: DMT family transporter [Candidatus Hydrogenedentes bacterium]|nr:DMT family transporter [Candidatus Hydrogenedentota bacterium]
MMRRDTGKFPSGPFALLFFGACLIGLSPIWVRWSPVEPIATGFWRFALSLPFFLLLLGLLRLRGDTVRTRLPQGKGWLVLVPGAFYAGDLAAWHWSVELTSVANSTLLANAAPIFVTLAAWLFFRERSSKAFVIGMAIAFGGVVILMGQILQLSRQYFIGDLLGLTTAVFYAGYQLSCARLRGALDTPHLMAWVSAVGAIILMIWAWAVGEALLPHGENLLQGWAVLFALGFLSQFCGQGLIIYALAHLPAPFASVTLLMQPVVATIAAWILLNERLSPWQLAGGAVVLIGIYLARRASMGERRAGLGFRGSGFEE